MMAYELNFVEVCACARNFGSLVSLGSLPRSRYFRPVSRLIPAFIDAIPSFLPLLNSPISFLTYAFVTANRASPSHESARTLAHLTNDEK